MSSSVGGLVGGSSRDDKGGRPNGRPEQYLFQRHRSSRKTVFCLQTWMKN